MKAVRVHAYGPPEALAWEDVPTPEPAEREVLIKIAAAGVNYIDIYHRTGLYPGEVPFTPGMEGAGVVAGVGPGVADFQSGDRVAYAMQRGAYAEYATVPAAQVVPVPEGVSDQQAAAVMLQGMTAHYLSHDTYALGETDVALIHAAAGGVGLLLVQMAKRRGARVIGTVSTDEKAALAREYGADEVILYTEQDFEAETKRLTGGRGVDVVYEAVGKTTFEQSLNCLRPRGYLVLFGQASGPVPPVDPQILNTKGSLYLTRPTLRDYVAGRSELTRRAGDLFAWIGSGDLRVRIDVTYPLAEASDAHRYVEERRTRGKVLLVP